MDKDAKLDRRSRRRGDSRSDVGPEWSAVSVKTARSKGRQRGSNDIQQYREHNYATLPSTTLALKVKVCDFSVFSATTLHNCDDNCFLSDF